MGRWESWELWKLLLLLLLLWKSGRLGLAAEKCEGVGRWWTIL